MNKKSPQSTSNFSPDVLRLINFETEKISETERQELFEALLELKITEMGDLIHILEGNTFQYPNMFPSSTVEVLKKEHPILKHPYTFQVFSYLSKSRVPNSFETMINLMNAWKEARPNVKINQSFIDFSFRKLRGYLTGDTEMNFIDSKRLEDACSRFPSLSYSSVKNIQDRVHGLMSFDGWLISDWVDTPVVQRLRNLKQLGSCCYVYPNSVHSRFEHSLGVSYLAGKYHDALSKSLRLDPRSSSVETSKRAVQIAGLLHDVGHGPFSHTFEYVVNRKRGAFEKWNHEEMSLKFVDYLFNDLENKSDSHADFYDNNLQDLVKEMIHGVRNEQEMSGLDEMTRVSLDIVSNKRTGLDVDKFDYLLRDNCEGAAPLDVDRIMRYSKVLDGEICYDIKESLNIHRVFAERAAMHRKMYNHRKVCAIELMICDVLDMLDPVLKLSDPESLNDPETFLRLDDSCFDSIPNTVALSEKFKSPLQLAFELSEVPFENFRKLVDLKKRIVGNRDIYKFVAESEASQAVDDIKKMVDSTKSLSFNEQETSAGSSPCHFQKQVEHYERLNALQKKNIDDLITEIVAKGEGRFSSNDICIKFSNISLGTESPTPLGNAQFFQNQQKVVLNWQEAGLLPWATKTLALRIYAKHQEHVDVVFAASKIFFEAHKIPVGVVDSSRSHI
eukprot:GDKK01059580.1.p1 GENE.GDKK01059580.1~~GDKK01059580.1.p1  ORF type:complete len:674 (-),score=121.80 GDKK01059580.1:96-2117(-)